MTINKSQKLVALAATILVLSATTSMIHQSPSAAAEGNYFDYGPTRIYYEPTNE